jgi:hypothetical protein
MTGALSLAVELQPDWHNVTRASEAVALLALGRYGDGDLRDALAMVSGELLENAIKYADPQQLVRLSLHEDATTIVVTVTNAVVQDANIQRLADRLAWLRSHPDPAEAWAAALAQSAVLRGASAGLGIIRIAYEGGSRIDYDASTPGTLTVRAMLAKAPSNG